MRPTASSLRLLRQAKTTAAPATRTSTSPAYSPDGTQIYYNRYTPEADTIQAWVMNADGSDQHRFNADGPGVLLVGGRDGAVAGRAVGR